jgi:hypothetical protein
MRVSRILNTIALQRAKIVGVPKFLSQLLENRPVPLFSFGADLTLRWRLRSAATVVVEQRVVNIE